MLTHTATAQERVTAYKGRLVQALADLATLDEQREKTKTEIDALRNFLSGVSLGEISERDSAALRAEGSKLPTMPTQESYPANAGGTD